MGRSRSTDERDETAVPSRSSDNRDRPVLPPAERTPLSKYGDEPGQGSGEPRVVFEKESRKMNGRLRDILRQSPERRPDHDFIPVSREKKRQMMKKK